jgi:hypothetical protein
MSYQGNGTEGYPVEAFASAAATTVVAMAAGSAAAASTSATNAATNAATALTHATTSAINAGATLWVSGTTYAIGDARYSAVTGQTYRRLTAGAGTIDPSADATNWKPILLDMQTNLPTIRPSLNLDFANSKTVDPRIGFTRATTATYYDGKTTSKAEENLLTYSQTFGGWAGSASTATDNATVAPDATTTAAHIVPTSALSRHYKYSPIVASAITSNSTITGSVYVKAGAYNYCFVQLTNSNDNGGSRMTRSIDLTTGTIGGFTADSNVVSQSAVVTSVGNGWFRVALTMTATVSGSGGANIIISPMPTDGTTYTNGGDFLPSFSTDGVSGAYFWGAQLELRGFLTSYTPTTTDAVTNYVPTLLTAVANQPRINHDPVTGECLGLLVEQPSTNLLLRSAEFDNASWVKYASATVVPNSIVAPNGTLSASTLVSTSSQEIYQGVGKASSAITYTSSVYAKFRNTSQITLVFSDFVAGVAAATFNLTTGTVSGVAGSIWTGVSGTMLPVGNDWFRCSLTATSPATSTVYVSVTTASSTAGASVYLWGAQLEAQQLTTSYIPTTSASVTRNGDAALISGNNLTSFYNQIEGTIFIEANYNKSSADGLSNRVMYEVGTNSPSRMLGYNNTSSGASFTVIESNATQAQLNPTGVADNSFKKVAHAYKTNDFGASLNGSVALVDSSGKVPRSSAFGVGCTVSGTAQLNGHIKQLAYYPERLSNATIQAMTAQ